MSRPVELTIVMYHHVRHPDLSPHPELKGVSCDRFMAQLDFLCENYDPVPAQAVADALDNGRPLPDRACLLTFDDGHVDHFSLVFPELRKRGLPAAFYPPAQATRRQTLLDVNKIHLIIAKTGYASIHRLIRLMRDLMRDFMRDPPHGLMREPGCEQTAKTDNAHTCGYDDLFAKYAKPARYDCPEVVFVKSMLQHVLPQPLRTRLLDALFREIVGENETELAQNMYMSIEMLRELAQAGMHVGAHGDSHRWTGKLPADEQLLEVEASLRMLRQVHRDGPFWWSMSYPFGDSDENLRSLCSERGCAFGLTTIPEVARLSRDNRLSLARLDTNDLPPF